MSTPLALPLQLINVVVLVVMHQRSHNDPFRNRRPSNPTRRRQTYRRLRKDRVRSNVVCSRRDKVDMRQMRSIFKTWGQRGEGHQDGLVLINGYSCQSVSVECKMGY